MTRQASVKGIYHEKAHANSLRGDPADFTGWECPKAEPHHACTHLSPFNYCKFMSIRYIPLDAF